MSDVSMGTLITLGVGKMEIDWGKNSFFRDHSELFRPEDIKTIPYYYAGENGDIIIEEKEGLSRKLSAMKDRLELLGYTMDDVWGMYDALAKEYSDAPFYEALSFDVFAKLLEEIDIKKSTLWSLRRNMIFMDMILESLFEGALFPTKRSMTGS